MKSAKKLFFQDELTYWNTNHNGRKMPWKGEKNPYCIWLSEIILQQTRVEQGTAYYQRFITNYPTVHDLANASETDVYKLWEGLGYYSRCKNLHFTAKYISGPLGGNFPSDYNSILELKGIGPYTAAAISSFAFDLPYAVLDGNVYRVLSRFFGIDIPVDTNNGKIVFQQLADELLNKDAPAVYNQAIMDFGATICKPLPLCRDCLLSHKCTAFLSNSQGDYPVKIKKLKKTTRWFYYLAIRYKDSFLVRKRLHQDIWQNLHELILHESNTELSIEELMKVQPFLNAAEEGVIRDISEVYTQQLSHQTIKGRFVFIELSHPPDEDGFILMDKPELNMIAFPKFITRWMQESRAFN